MKTTKTLAGTALGIGLGMVLAPSAALAVVNVSPGAVRPGGTVTISASCNAGVAGNASVTGPGGSFNVVLPSLKSGTAGASGTLKAPSAAGVYNVSVKCSDGMNAGTGRFTVSPTGAPAGGDGGKTDNSLMLAAGTAMVGAAAGGYLLMRRRANATL